MSARRLNEKYRSLLKALLLFSIPLLAAASAAYAEPSLMGAKLGSSLKDIERTLGKGRLTQRMVDGAYRISGCREYRTWKITAGSLEICFDDEGRAVRMTLSAMRPVSAYGNVVLCTDTFLTALAKLPSSAIRDRTSGEGMIVQTLTYQTAEGTTVRFAGTAVAKHSEAWDDSITIRSVTIESGHRRDVS